jgi:hypothetical protein
MKDAKQRSYQRERYINAIIYFCRITWRCERKKEEGEKNILIIPIATRY